MRRVVSAVFLILGTCEFSTAAERDSSTREMFGGMMKFPANTRAIFYSLCSKINSRHPVADFLSELETVIATDGVNSRDLLHLYRELQGNGHLNEAVRVSQALIGREKPHSSDVMSIVQLTSDLDLKKDGCLKVVEMPCSRSIDVLEALKILYSMGEFTASIQKGTQNFIDSQFVNGETLIQGGVWLLEIKEKDWALKAFQAVLKRKSPLPRHISQAKTFISQIEKQIASAVFVQQSSKSQAASTEFPDFREIKLSDGQRIFPFHPPSGPNFSW